MVPTHEVHNEPRRRPAGGRGTRRAFALFAWLFAAGVVFQVFLAGLAVLVEPARLADHQAFGHLVLLIPYVMLAVGLVARLPGRTLALTGGLVVLAVAHDAFVYIPVETEAEFLRALHAVNALVLFWIAVLLARGATGMLDSRQTGMR
jgi:hypothetical protein